MNPTANTPSGDGTRRPAGPWARGWRLVRSWLSRLDLGNTITIYRVDDQAGDGASDDNLEDLDGITYDSAVFDLAELQAEAGDGEAAEAPPCDDRLREGNAQAAPRRDGSSGSGNGHRREEPDRFARLESPSVGDPDRHVHLSQQVASLPRG
ncbi:MAG: hypothetical protein KDD11_13375 [Acidobacteria bacterium]|nr:hypothetical protein [Acidobacteriota bacterium]